MLKLTDSQKEILNQAVDKYGNLQKVIAMEEMAELTKEISKSIRNENENKEAIAEEMCDVYIMLEQLKIMFGIDECLLQNEITLKIRRLEKRLNKC